MLWRRWGWASVIKIDQEVREKLSDVQHAIWSHWMRYLFSKCEIVEDTFSNTEVLSIPCELEERWKRQAKTPYAELTDKEQESDRNQADKVIVAMIDLMAERVNWLEAPDWAKYACVGIDHRAMVYRWVFCVEPVTMFSVGWAAEGRYKIGSVVRVPLGIDPRIVVISRNKDEG